MKKYIYSYETAVAFSQPVVNHSVLLRPLPAINAYMNVEQECLVVPPSWRISRGTDQLGNRIVYGTQRDAHSSLVYVSTGIVGMDEYYSPADAVPLMVYRQPTPLTFLPEGHRLIVHSSPADICHQVHEAMQYVPRVTDVSTPATQVADTLQGVCQDYAHLMIALCRAQGLAARYVCGIIEGEGETHAWVEVFDGSGWVGFDPTHNCRISYGYMKLAHGRDAADCPVSRGLYAGEAVEQTQIHVMLKEI